MARKSNIVSFENARTRSNKRIPSSFDVEAGEELRDSTRSASRNGRQTGWNLELFSSPTGMNAWESVEGADERSSSKSGKSDRSGRSGANSSRLGRFNRVADRTARPERMERDDRSSRAGRSGRAEQAKFDDRSDRDEQANRNDRSERSDSRRRKRTKARAEKLFDRQFSAEAAGAPDEDAPRAALYEGKMGSSQRRSARMQRSSSAGPVSAKIDPSGWVANSGINARMLKVATGVICVVLACTFLYVPAQQYYQAEREHERLEAEYSTIEKRNDTLDVQNDILASDAGIEDAVRQKFGYVKIGEQTAVVTGLSENATDTSRDSENIEANVLAGSVKSPVHWYTPFLDAFFGVE